MKLWIIVLHSKKTKTTSVVPVKTTGAPPNLSIDEAKALVPGYDPDDQDFLEFKPFDEESIKVVG
jgi:hypothetical protein